MSHTHGGHGVMTDDEALEAAHFANVVDTFKQYQAYSLSANNRRRNDFYSLSEAHQALLEEIGWKKTLEEVDDKIYVNAAFLARIVNDPEIFQEDDEAEEEEEEDTAYEGSNQGDVGGCSHTGHDHHSHAEPPHSHTPLRDSHFHDAPTPSPSHSHSHDAPQHSHDPRSHAHSHPGGRGRGGGPHQVMTRKKRDRRTLDHDMDKLRSTIKQFVRDWSEEGKPERDSTYTPIVEALKDHFRDIPDERRKDIKVLVPGAGLARLAWDVAHDGFTCQGNEFSHYMLLASFFILNRTKEINQHTIYPFVHSFSNIPSSSSLLREIKIPDVSPSDLPHGSDFSLVAGDFEEVYGVTEEGGDRAPQVGKWNAVLTCFFIDTARNIINYLEIIHRILAPGGVWINLGPLLWHFENSSGSDIISIELNLEEVKALCRKIGFKIENERTLKTTYATIPDGMLNYVYEAAFWTATKI